MLNMILLLKNNSIYKGGEAMKVKKCRGMTLVELVAAMAILGIVLVSASMLISTITKYNSIMKCRVTNAAIAQHVIEYYKVYDFKKLDVNAITDAKKGDQSYKRWVYFTQSSKGDNLTPAIENSKVGASSPQADYDHKIEIVFTLKDDNMIAIDATVWDSKNKNQDKYKVEYVTLRSIEYEGL